MKSKSHGIFRKAACLGLTAVIGATFVAGQLTFADHSGIGVSEGTAASQSLAFENVTGKVNLTDIKLNNMTTQAIAENASYADTERTVIVTLEGKSLSELDSADQADRDEIAREQRAFLKNLKKAGVSYEYKSSYASIVNAVAVNVNLSALKTIKGIEGVSTVSVGSTYARPKEVETTSGAQTNDSEIYENGIYKSEGYLDKADGSGMTVAILDTGLDYTHEAFEPVFEDSTVNSFTRESVTNIINNAVAANATDPEPFKSLKDIGATADDVYVNAKVPFAFDYADRDTDVYPSYSQHGTHVAGIVAGKADKYKNKDGNVATDAEGKNLKFRGVAPEAQLVICKVFTDDLEDEKLGGAESVDILDALEDCYNLGVDVINMSLGTSAGFSASSLGLSEEDEEGHLLKRVYKNIRDKGISLIVAASNDYSAGYGSAFGTNLATNPDSGTVGSPSTFTGAMSVASINGQSAPYMLANATIEGDTVTGGTAVYYEESRNEDSDPYVFLDEMLIDEEGKPIDRATYRYVMVPGTGEATDYTQSVKDELKKDKDEYGKVIAVIQRGRNSFKDKITTAKSLGADAVIVYNNVSGMIRMSLGDMNERTRIPSASVSLEIGNKLKEGGRKTGTITLDRSYLAGPFMNDYSSWGVTPDLELKPDVTSHGGEITSTVAGGYAEMSGTSMACPNLAGFTALLRSYLQKNHKELWNNDLELAKLTNNIVMSTAQTVYDQNKLPYSPRKQGAGLAKLNNVFSTKAYLYTKDTADTDDPDRMCEDGRPKAELGDDSKRKKKGVYNITFYVKNFGTDALTFKTNSIFMTETLGQDGKSVAEKAYLFEDANHKTNATWTVDGESVEEGGTFTVAGGEYKEIKVELKLTSKEMSDLEKNFKNGMFVEGFIQLKSQDDAQCDLNLPFMGFYGDWKKAPMLDFDCFDIAKDAKDTSKKDEERRQPSVWATQGYAYYWNDKYSMPLGSFAYLQDEDKEHTSDYIYVEEEHIAISRFNEYEYDGSPNNYMSTTGIKALYAGLLRNAELVTYKLTNVDTGELVKEDEVYRVNKAYAAGGTAVPAQVLLELRTEDLGLEGNGKYRLDFDFYFDAADAKTDGAGSGGQFSMNFYIDYEAPLLLDSRLRFQDKKDETGKVTQDVYLDLDIFDNHYPQAVILCYLDGEEDEEDSLKLATEYVTPVINPKKNSTNTVSIDVTEFYNDYKGSLYVEIDDYALNHNVYRIEPTHSQTGVCTDSFTILGPDAEEVKEITVKVNQTVALSIGNSEGAHKANYTWTTDNGGVAKVNGNSGEVFGVSVGKTTITVTGNKSVSKSVTVNVVEGDDEIKGLPSVSFGTVFNADDVPLKASGTIEVNPAQSLTLGLVPDPWYYPMSNSDFDWTSTDPDAVSVDSNGNVKVLYEEDTRTLKQVTITATHKTYKSCAAEVTLLIRNPYTVVNATLTRYEGGGGVWDAERGLNVLKIPNNKSIMTIGEKAFEDNENVNVVIIPKAVTTIDKEAFKGCKNLKKICFIDEEEKDITDENLIADSSLNMIMQGAFKGCASLETVDLTNCKVITVDREAFKDCTSLKEVIKWKAIGTMYRSAFEGCTKLTSVDLTELHVAGERLFAGCTLLSEIKTGKNTALGERAFEGCKALKTIEINCKTVPAYAFYNCSKLESVTINEDISSIGAYAFANCVRLTSVKNNGSHKISKIGDYAFSSCSNLNSVSGLLADTVLGKNVFSNVPAADGECKNGDTLVKAARTVSSATLPAGVTKIGAYAFSGSRLASGVTTVDLTGVTEIGEGAFDGLTGLASVTIPTSWTEIPAYAFRGTSLTSIDIPAGITKIGEGAFEDCASLKQITFNGTALKEIGDSAFAGTAVTAANIPASVTTVGGLAFSECPKLKTAELPSVTKMGAGVFAFCPSLETVTFGDAATTVGTYTFMNSQIVGDEEIQITENNLKTVTLGEKIKVIDDSAFLYCEKLETIRLSGAFALAEGEKFTIGQQAFGGCNALATVEGLDKVAVIGMYAFADCKSLTSVDLSAAESILYAAFRGCDNLSTLKLGSKLEGIGDDAFASNALKKVTIPASCGYVGVSAFSSSGTLLSYEVEAGNATYFTENDALYRNIDKENGVYEFVAYPDGRTADEEDGVRSFKVKEGTAVLGRYSFASVSAARLNKVILPYTLKAVGAGAFYASGVDTYQFESISAPTLLERYTGRTLSRNTYSSNSFFYDNFTDGTVTETVDDVQYVRPATLRDFAPWYPGDNRSDMRVSSLTIRYPSNGTGYDNFLYSKYFGVRVALDEMPEDDTRTLVALIDKILAEANAEAVAGWNKSNVTREKVVTYSDNVKTAHALYNGLKTDVQLNFVGQDRVNALFAVEDALKPVKKLFNISVKIRSISVAPTSAHKSEYKVGETFSLNGLKFLVTYDDYSQSTIDAEGNFKPDDISERPLQTYDEAVTLEGLGDYAGRTVSVKIVVTEGAVDVDDGDNGGLTTVQIVLIVLGCVAAVAVAAAVVVLVLKKKKSGGEAISDDKTASDGEETVTDGEPADGEDGEADEKGGEDGEEGNTHD